LLSKSHLADCFAWVFFKSDTALSSSIALRLGEAGTKVRFLTHNHGAAFSEWLMQPTPAIVASAFCAIIQCSCLRLLEPILDGIWDSFGFDEHWSALTRPRSTGCCLRRLYSTMMKKAMGVNASLPKNI
jgi:hypothetical protein